MGLCLEGHPAIPKGCQLRRLAAEALLVEQAPDSRQQLADVKRNVVRSEILPSEKPRIDKLEQKLRYLHYAVA